jgi:hypothetical protein
VLARLNGLVAFCDDNDMRSHRDGKAIALRIALHAACNGSLDRVEPVRCLARQQSRGTDSGVALGFEEKLRCWNIPFDRTCLEDHGRGVESDSLQDFPALILVRKQMVRRTRR